MYIVLFLILWHLLNIWNIYDYIELYEYFLLFSNSPWKMMTCHPVMLFRISWIPIHKTAWFSLGKSLHQPRDWYPPGFLLLQISHSELVCRLEIQHLCLIHHEKLYKPVQRYCSWADEGHFYKIVIPIESNIGYLFMKNL